MENIGLTDSKNCDKMGLRCAEKLRFTKKQSVNQKTCVIDFSKIYTAKTCAFDKHLAKCALKFAVFRVVAETFFPDFSQTEKQSTDLSKNS